MHGVSIAMAEQKGLLAKHFPRVVIQAGDIQEKNVKESA